LRALIQGTQRLVLVLLLGAGAGVAWAGPQRKPPPDPKEEALAELRHEWAKLVRDIPGVQVEADQRLVLLRAALALDTDSALRWVAARIEEPGQADIRGVVEPEVVETAPDSRVVLEFFRARLDANEGDRAFARDYLVGRALRERDAEWLTAWFETAPREDRFRALTALGKLRSPATLSCATALVADPSWKPDESGVVGCTTIIMSLTDFEGEPAARLLLLLRTDPRFGPADREAIEEATRRWKERDLASYVDLASLGRGAPEERADNARFCGRIALERARLPLLLIAKNANEDPQIRAACAEALGSLRIARTDLARELTALAARSWASGPRPRRWSSCWTPTWGRRPARPSPSGRGAPRTPTG